MKAVLEKLSGATMRSMQVAIKPAKPFAFGVLEKTGTPVFGLPGNPVSARVSYELFVRPALRSTAGCIVLDRPRLAAVAEVDLPRPRDGKLHLMRVMARTGTDGSLAVRIAGGQDSNMLSVMANSNALALLPDGDGVRAGQLLRSSSSMLTRCPPHSVSRGERGRRGHRSSSDRCYCAVGASIPLMPSMLATFFSAQYSRMPFLPLRVDHWSMVGR